MSTAGVQSWTYTANDNTTINGINIAESCPAANINNAIRQAMSSVLQEIAYQGADISATVSMSLAGVDWRFSAATGSASIVHVGTGRAGLHREILWNSPSTIVGSANLITDGGGNIVTQTNDLTLFLSLGSGSWRAVNFPVSGLPPALSGAVTASATIGDAVFTKTSGGAYKLTPSGITAAAGSLVVWDAAGKYPTGDGSQITNITSAVTRYYGSYATNTDLTTAIPLDNSAPTSTEGTQIISIGSVVVSTGTKRVRARVLGYGGGTANSNYIIGAIYRGTTSIQATAIPAGVPVVAGVSLSAMEMEVEEVPGAATYTYSLRVGPDTGTIRMNGSNSARLFGGISVVTLVIEVWEP